MNLAMSIPGLPGMLMQKAVPGHSATAEKENQGPMASGPFFLLSPTTPFRLTSEHELLAVAVA
jgi:hypothetical protein